MEKEIESFSKSILTKLRDILLKLQLWIDLESDLVMQFSAIPQKITEQNKEQVIKGLNSVIKFLSTKNVSESDYEFITESIKNIENTKQISLYYDNISNVDPEIINKYAQIGEGTEGIVGIHLAYNFEQLKAISNGVYLKTGLVKFYISREKEIRGRIVSEMYQYAQNVPIITLCESKKMNEWGEPLKKEVFLFGEVINSKMWERVKEIESPFFVYRFISNEGKDSILFTLEEQEIGEYIVTGVTTNCNDFKQLTESSKLMTKLQYIFAQEMKTKKIKFKNKEQFKDFIIKKDFKKDVLHNYPFTFTKEGNQSKNLLIYPEWYKIMLWSWLLHSPKGDSNTYPLHLLVQAKTGTGKSSLIEALYDKFDEIEPIFGGTNSTLKSLVPSFRTIPPKIGYLAVSRLFGLCDEFFRAVLRSGTKNDSEREEDIAMMNDLLEHRNRMCGSGNSEIKVSMSARILAMTNPVRDCGDLDTLLKKFDGSFLGRWLIYYQDDEIISMARSARGKFEKVEIDLVKEDFIGMVEFLQSFHCEYNKDKMYDIYDDMKSILTPATLDHYNSRHEHHIECIFDGIIKHRCLTTNNMDFVAIEEDYDMLKIIWHKIIGSWTDIRKVRGISDMNKRIYHMPEIAQYLFWKIANNGEPITKTELKEISDTTVSSQMFNNNLVMLIDNELIIEEKGELMTWRKNLILNDEQKRVAIRFGKLYK